MPKQSINQLSELTGKDRRTIKMRLDSLPHEVGPKQSHLYDSAQALAAIYGGASDFGELTLEQARINQAVADTELKRVTTEERRRDRIPIEIVNETNDQVFQATAAILKSNKGKTLTETVINEIFDLFRSIPTKLKW